MARHDHRRPVQLSAIVTAYNRIDQTIATIERILGCSPPPVEVLVHVDGGRQDCANAIRAAFPNIQVVVSSDNIGPGGGRNKLIAAASQPIVASFDDDSFPLDGDYFQNIDHLFAEFSDAAVVCARVFERGQPVSPPDLQLSWRSDFSGGGCAYRRDAFLSTDGYVPLPLAYGMEEVDLAMRFASNGRMILFAPRLRVFHDSDLSRHASSSITAASLANLALLAFLRYPPILWPVGLIQLFNRVVWLIRNGRLSGLGAGLVTIPGHCWAHRQYRRPLSIRAVRRYLQLRRHPIFLS